MVQLVECPLHKREDLSLDGGVLLRSHSWECRGGGSLQPTAQRIDELQPL